jgi:hypothetical protein
MFRPEVAQITQQKRPSPALPLSDGAQLQQRF